MLWAGLGLALISAIAINREGELDSVAHHAHCQHPRGQSATT